MSNLEGLSNFLERLSNLEGLFNFLEGLSNLEWLSNFLEGLSNFLEGLSNPGGFYKPHYGGRFFRKSFEK